MRIDVVLQAAFLVKASLCHVPVTSVLEGTSRLILFVLRVLLQVRLWRVADHAALPFVSCHVHLCIALSIAERLMERDLVLRARRTREPAMPHEVEGALSLGALEVVRDDHLGEIVRAFLVLGIALVLDVRLILFAWFDRAWISLIVNDLIASSIIVVERSDIEDAAAEVLKLPEVALGGQSFHFT